METIHELIEAYLEHEDKSIVNKILDEIKTTEKLWSVFARPTNNFYMGIEKEKPAAYLFTNKEYADDFAREIRWEGIEVKSLEIRLEQRIGYFSDLYRSGFEVIMIDKGQDNMVMSLFNLIDRLEESEDHIINPVLMRSAAQFYQELSRKRAVKGMQDVMCREIYNARFLIPAAVSGAGEPQRDQNNLIIERAENVSHPCVTNQQGKKFYPIFTDWLEFGKFDKKKKYQASIVSFRDLKKLIRKVDGIAVNPFGFNLILDQQKLENIEKENVKLRIV